MASSVTTQTPYSGATINHHSSVYSYIKPPTKPANSGLLVNSSLRVNSSLPVNSNQEPNPGNVSSPPQPVTSQSTVFHFGGIPGTASVNKVIPARNYKLGKLNQRQKQFYKEHGFLVIPNLLPSQLITECQALLTDTTKEDDNKLAVYENIPMKFGELPEMVDYVTSLVGHNARLVDSILAHNASKIHHLTPSSHHETHPATHSFHSFHPRRTSIVSWAPLKNSTFTLNRESQNGQNAASISVEMSPGDCLFTHPSLVNQSDKTTFLCSQYSTSRDVSADLRSLQKLLLNGSKSHL